MTELLDRILSLNSFQPVLAQLRAIDEKHTGLIETALTTATAETHDGIRAAGNTGQLRYWLYREVVEIKAHTSNYLSYTDMMATRETNLWKFTLAVADQFFEIIFDALDTYFETKKRLMADECEARSSWYSSIADSSKKLLVPVNLVTKTLNEASERIGVDVIPDGDVVDTKSVVETLLARHLDPRQVERDVVRIFEEASQRVAEAWKKQIQSQMPDLSCLKVFASHSATMSVPRVIFQLGVAEQTFAVGIAGGVVGAIGLAAGWHTLTYATIEVFPPVAVFSVIAAIGLAVLTKNKAVENRQKQVSEAVNQYHRQLLLQIDTQRMKELNGQTIREAMNEQNRKIVTETLAQWERMISGNLRAEHYRMLVAATTAHLMLVEKALEECGCSN